MNIESKHKKIIEGSMDASFNEIKELKWVEFSSFIKNNEIEKVKLFLNNPQNANLPFISNLNGPLRVMAYYGHLELMDFLISQSQVKDFKEYNLVFKSAIVGNKKSSIKFLLNKLDINLNPRQIINYLNFSLVNNKPDMVYLFMDLSPEKNIKYIFSESKKYINALGLDGNAVNFFLLREKSMKENKMLKENIKSNKASPLIKNSKKI